MVGQKQWKLHQGLPEVKPLPVIALLLLQLHESQILKIQTICPVLLLKMVETDEDTWWTLDDREADEAVAAWGLKFLTWLWSRKEKEIAVVSHSGFLTHTLRAFGDDCNLSVKNEIHKSRR